MLIKHRLLIAALINLIIVAVVAYFSLTSSTQVQSSHQQLSQQTLPIIRTLEQMQFGAMRIVSSTSEAGLLKYLGAKDHDEALEGELIQTGIILLKKSVKDYKILVLLHFPDEISYIAPIENAAFNLISQSEQFIEILELDSNKSVLLGLKEQLESSEQTLLTLLDTVLKHETEEVTEQSLVATTEIERHYQILLIGISIIIFISIVLAWYNSSKISTPLNELRNAALQVTLGNLEAKQLPQRDNDEIGQLSLSFNTMKMALKAQQEVILYEQRQTENILQVMKDILITTDAGGVIQKVNKATCEQLQYAEQELIGSNINQLLIQQGKHRSLDQFFYTLKGGHVESVLLSKAGIPIPVLASLSQINLEQANDSDFLLVATNISERKVAEEKIHKLAFYDALTGLPNRTLFADRLKQALTIADTQESILAVLFLDIDNFKQINDSLGHAVGDGMLREISEILTSAVRSSDYISHDPKTRSIPTISRHGGDEFLILLPDLIEHSDIYLVAERILQQVSINIQIEGHKIFSSVSIGIAIYPEHGENERILIQNADTALYNAKAAGKNQYSVFEEHMNHSVLRHMDIENNLRTALDNDEFRLYYQPQFDLEKRKVIGMEALIRWHHPEWSVVSPLEFIPIAESNGLILPIGEWVLREACTQWVEWKSRGYEPGKISVNISASQFKNKNLSESILDIIQQTGVNPEALVLEITESVLMQDAKLTHTQLQFIKDSGIHLAVDDFGTGYSSLSYLKNFSLDFLKIDRSFIRDLESSHSDQEIVRTIINMAKNLNLELVAEGVETSGQVDILQASGCHFIQGTLLSKPVVGSEYEELFLKNTHQID